MTAATAKARYDDLALKREPFLRRGRYCAEQTIPALLPPEGFNGTQDLPLPYQGLGSRAVVYLASKLMVALMPPGQNSFLLDVPIEVLTESGKQEVPDDMKKNLALVEKSITSEIERKNWRNPTNTSLQSLLVAGNACEHMGADNRIRSYRLDQYVVSRDLSGDLAELIVRDAIDAKSLPEKMAGMVVSQHNNDQLYTWCKRRKDGQWEIRQELNDQVIPGSKKVLKTLPFIVYRYSVIPGEDYGRSKVEEHYPDLASLDGLTKSMLDLAKMNAKNYVLVRPNATGQRLKKFLKDAANGDVGIGNPEDVSMIRFENVPGAQITAQEIERLYGALSTAFLLGTGLRRDADRVTATELRMVAEELEGALGGVYSMLSEEMQRERLTRLIANLEARNAIVEMSDLIDIKIIVGLEALGRERDALRVQQALSGIAGIPPEILQDYVDWPSLLTRYFVGLGLPAAVNTEEQAQQKRQERIQSQAAQSAGLPQ